MSKYKNIVIIDNNDSFTANLYQLFDQNKNCTVKVIPSDQVQLSDLKDFDKIVLSPGPDTPRTYPILFEILQTYSTTKSILGICLGHQTIVEYFGGTLFNLPNPLHGQRVEIKQTLQHSIFTNIPDEFQVGLYHSWAAEKSSLPKDLNILALHHQELIMAVSHKYLDIIGLQFHPESYMTTYGQELIDNWMLL